MERLAKEMQEKKLQQELERQKEEDELKRKIKKPKPGAPGKEEPPLKKPPAANKQVAALLLLPPSPHVSPSGKQTNRVWSGGRGWRTAGLALHLVSPSGIPPAPRGSER